MSLQKQNLEKQLCETRAFFSDLFAMQRDDRHVIVNVKTHRLRDFFKTKNWYQCAYCDLQVEVL